MSTVYRNQYAFSNKNSTSWSEEFEDDSLHTAKSTFTALARRQDALYKYEELEDDYMVFSLSNFGRQKAAPTNLYNGIHRFSEASSKLPCELVSSAASPGTCPELLTPDSFTENSGLSSFSVLRDGYERFSFANFKNLQNYGVQDEPNEKESNSHKTFYKDCQDEIFTLKEQAISISTMKNYSNRSSSNPALGEPSAPRLSQASAKSGLNSSPSYKTSEFRPLLGNEVTENMQQIQPKIAPMCENTGGHFVRKWVYNAYIEPQYLQYPKRRLPLYRIPELRYNASQLWEI